MLGMQGTYLSTEILRHGKTLILFVANFRDEHPTKDIEAIVADAFEKVSPYIKEDMQTLYIRDNSELTLKDGFYWESKCSGKNEASIAMPRWGDDEFQVRHLTLAIHQTLYSLVRRQHTGANATFGDEVLSRGLAAYYASTVTGFEWPTALNAHGVQKYMRRRILRCWFRWYDSVHENWLPKPGDLLVATEVGYELAVLLCGEDDVATFCLENAMHIYGLFYTVDKVWVLNHPKRRRSARIMEGRAHRPDKWGTIRYWADVVFSF